MRKKVIGVTVGTPLKPSKIEEEIKPIKTVNGIAPDENGNVEINGAGGENGKTPYIKDGNWWIGDTDTGVKAKGTDGKDGINGTGLYRGTVVFDEDSASSDETEIVETIDKPNGDPFIVGDMVIETNGKIWRIFDNKGHVTLVTSTKGEKGDPYTLTDTDKTEIAAKVVEMLGGAPVYAVIDENNIVTIKGLSEDESYTFKLEMKDGSAVDVGEFEPVQPIINQLPISTDANGNLYVGTNGEKGYNTGKKISTTSGSESSASGACVSGFIPLLSGVQSEILIENITLSASASVNNIVFYKADKTKISGYAGTAGAFISNVKVIDGAYRILTKSWFTEDDLPAFVRFSCGGITDETIVTINEYIG